MKTDMAAAKFRFKGVTKGYPKLSIP